MASAKDCIGLIDSDTFIDGGKSVRVADKKTQNGQQQ